MESSKLNGKVLSEDQYFDFKNKVKQSGIVRKSVNLSELTIISQSLIGYAGVDFEMTEEAWKNLIKLTGLSIGVMKEIDDKLGENVSKKLLDMMRIACSNNSNKQKICMLFNKHTTKIVAFTKSADGVLSNNGFFTLFEQTMNNHSGMQIKNMAISENGNVEISVLNNNWEFNVNHNGKGLSDEYFKTGLVFLNTPDATIVNPFNERLVCTNGMITAEQGLSLILRRSNAQEVSSFFDAVTNLKGTANFNEIFKARIIKMMDTQASYDEMLQTFISCEWNIQNAKQPDVINKLNEFIPLDEVKNAYLKHNVNLNMLKSKEHKKIRTMLTVWELVNSLTDLSSHPTKYGFMLNSDASMFNLQRKAGEIAFKQQYDLELPFRQLF